MRILAVWMGAVVGCMGVRSPDAARTPKESIFSCESGTQTTDPERTERYRLLPGTDVMLCLDAQGIPDGSHVERWGDITAAEGTWKGGKRDGVWTTWRSDGAFQSSATFEEGIERGLIVTVGSDGLLTEIEMDNGIAISIRTKGEASPMPEWESGARVLGTRYTTPLSGG